MKDYYIRCFVEGFKEGLRLPYDLVRNLLMAVPLTIKDFLNRDRPYLRDLPPQSKKPDGRASVGGGADRPAAS